MGWVTRAGTYTANPSGFVRMYSTVKVYSNGNSTASIGSASFDFTITDIPANANVDTATVTYTVNSPTHGINTSTTTCNGISIQNYNQDVTTDIKSLFSDGTTYTNVLGNFSIPYTFQMGYSEGLSNGYKSEMTCTNIRISVAYTYREFIDESPTSNTYNGTTGAKAGDFLLRSSWTRNANGSETTPTIATKTVSFTISGIPAESTVTSALLSVTCKNSVCGPQKLYVTGGSLTRDLNKNFDNILNFTAYVTGNGTFDFTFTFQEYGGCLLTAGKHEGVMQFENVSLDVAYTYSAPEEADPAETDTPDYTDLIGKTESSGICLYSADVEDFSDNGYGTLRPTRCVVTEEAGGAYEAELVIPMAQNGSLWEYIGIGSILKIPVPVVTLDAFQMSGAAYWKVGNTSVQVKSRVPTITRVASTSGYSNWSGSEHYTRGTKVVYNGKVWQYTGTGYGRLDGTIIWPATQAPGSVGYWKDVTSYSTKTNSGETVETLTPDTIFTKIEDINDNWMRVQTQSGNTGYIEKKYASYYSALPVDVQTRTIRNQCFRVYRIEKESDTRLLTVNARHLSYDFNNTILGVCAGKGMSVRAAIDHVLETTLDEDNRQIYTNISDQTVDLDCSWESGTSALLNPDTGIVPQLQAKLVRDNHDFFIFEDTHDDNGYMITYSKNMKSLHWSIDTTDMCTRVFPHCKDADDGDLLLPEQYVDSERINDYPVVFVESLSVNAKVGQKGTVDGVEYEQLTAEQCYTLMREAARERFTVDHADEPDIQIDIDLVELRTTEEYKQYEGVERLYMYDQVTISHPLISVETKAYMTGYTYDAILKRYESVTLTNAIRRFSETSSGFELKNDSIKFEKLSSTAVDRLMGVV